MSSTKIAEPAFNLTPAERHSYGVTVTAILPNTGALRTIIAKGSVLDALREACSILDGWNGDWRVRSISTPATIFRDMKGSRRPVPRANGRKSNSTSQLSAHTNSRFATPEGQMLGRIGRQDLMA